MLPEILFTTLKLKFNKNLRFAFLSTFFIGFFTHLYALTNNLLTWDSLYNFHSSQNTINLGRSFLSLAAGISSYYDLHSVNGLLSLCYLSLASACVVSILNLEKKISILFVAGIFATFPSVTSTLLYTYTADGYFLALLLSSIAILLTLKYRHGFFPASILVCLSYGIYQAYISYTISLILLWGLVALLFTNTSLKKILTQYSRFVLMGITGTILYLVSYKALLFIQNISPSDYQGISSFQIPDLNGLLYALKQSLIEFLYFFFGPLSSMNLFKILNIIIFILLIIFVIYQIKDSRMFSDFPRLLVTLATLIFFPFGCCIIYFVSSSLNYHMLMLFSCSMVYILVIVCFDKIRYENIKINLLSSWFVCIISVLTIYNFILIANISYLHAERNYERTYALVSRMADRIEQLEHFNTLDTLCIIGHFDQHDSTSINFPPNMTGISETYLASNQGHFTAMLDTYFAISLKNCPEQVREEIMNNKQIQEMPSWPDSECIVTYGNTVIIKIGND